MGLILFLLTPLREGRPDRQRACAVCRSISTHAPAGGATADAVIQKLGLAISTHAPAGGATADAVIQKLGLAISTHAPAGGATRKGLDLDAQKLVFLLTPLREGRPATAGAVVDELMISTHAPAGGATVALLYGLA